MTQIRNATIPRLNANIWHTLELVRLRQMPWHKKQVIFDRLQSLGLIEAIPQKTLTPSPYPAPMIAILTEDGRLALEMRSDQEEAIIKLLN